MTHDPQGDRGSGKPRTLKRRLALSLTVLALGVGLVGVLDRLLLPCSEGLIFEPGRAPQLLETVEFSCRVEISDQGLRSPRVAIPKPSGVVRVCAIGDSYTFGWGVEQSEAWPALLQERLTGPQRCEVVNCGQAGAGPQAYLRHARRVIPTLEPDVVVLALLQAEDLLQVDQPDAPIRRRSWRELWVPGLSRLARGRRPHRETAEVWAEAAAALANRYPSEVEALDAEVRGLFLSGNLNPGIFTLTRRSPRFLLESLDRDLSRARLSKLRRVLVSIERVCVANGARLIVVHVPLSAFVSRQQEAAARRVGFETGGEDHLVSAAPDPFVQELCDEEGIPFFAPLEAFREAARQGRSLYFRFDGHLNAAGHALLAELVSEELRRSHALAR